MATTVSSMRTQLGNSGPRSNNIRVEKIGGDDSFQMKQTLSMLQTRKQEWKKWIYIFSAFKDSVSKEASWNSTDYLISIAKNINTWNIQSSLDDIATLESFYRVVLEEELSDNNYKDAVLKNSMQAFEELRNIAKHANETGQKPDETNDYSVEFNGKSVSIMWWWEMLVSKLYSIAMGEEDWWIDTYAQGPNTSITWLKWEIAKRAMDALDTQSTAFVPWYSWNLDGWLYKRVWRGYSDWTAAMMYAGIRKNYMDTKVAFMIRKLYGLSSADPRIIDNVQLFTHMSYELLLQMIDPAWADAGFVNRAAAMPEIFRNYWEMVVYTDNGNETRITMDGPSNPPEWIQFVQNRRVQQIKIHSYHMNRDWYMAFATWLISRRWYSIIDDSSDATNINLMIALKKKQKGQSEEEYRKLEDEEYAKLCVSLESELRQWEEDEESEVSVTHMSKTLIFVGGENIDRSGTLAEITRILADSNINLWPAIQTDKPKVIVFWVDESEWFRAVQELHGKLIENKL